MHWEAMTTPINTVQILENKLILRRLQNKKFSSVYRSSNTIRVIKSRRLRWKGHVAIMKECRSAFKIVTGKPTGNMHSGRPRCRWKYNIRMDLKEMGIHTRNWVDATLGRY